MTPIILALGLAALLDSAEPFPTGVVVEHVACGTDPTQTYALYLPSSYTTERQWPALILMDPRGRALAPIDLFREAAERRGYILMSSYDTSSDGPWEPKPDLWKDGIERGQFARAI